MTGLEITFADEMASIMPVPYSQPLRSPTGSWLAAATSPSRVASPVPIASPQINGTIGAPAATETRPVRQDKKRLSLSFFTKGDIAPDKERKAEKQTTEDYLDTASTTTSSRSRSKDTARNRLSFLAPNSPPPEALPTFPHSSSQHSLALAQSRGQSIDGRPVTGKSGKGEKAESKKGTGSSVKKRLSLMGIGKKSSKSSVKSRVDNTLVEE
jgi:dedicator of cytokinesis protein 3